MLIADTAEPTKGIEARLYGSLYGGILFAVGSMIFAWAIEGHWIGPLIGIVILITGMYYIYQGGERKMSQFAGSILTELWNSILISRRCIHHLRIVCHVDTIRRTKRHGLCFSAFRYTDV